MLEAGRSDLSHIKDVAVRNDLANRLNQMEVDLQTVQTKSNQPKGQACCKSDCVSGNNERGRGVSRHE